MVTINDRNLVHFIIRRMTDEIKLERKIRKHVTPYIVLVLFKLECKLHFWIVFTVGSSVGR